MASVDVDGLRDAQWARLRDLVPGGRAGQRGPRCDNRLFVDALGAPVRLLPGPGQRQDTTRAHALIEGLAPKAVIADRGHDANPLREAVDKAGAEPVIPARSNRQEPRPHGTVLHKERNKIERFFDTLKQFRRIAIRHDKLLANHEGFVRLAAIAILLR